MADKKEICIEVTDLHKSYGRKEVLKGINLEVYKGEMFGFIGKNGAGKSTTIESIIGIKPFDSGEITVNGFSIRKKPNEAKATFGYVSSEPTCYDDMTGFSYVEFIASLYKVRNDVFIKNLIYLRTRLALAEEDLYRPIKEYSHGMQQKICLIASLIHNPSLWILDEPTVGLDAFTSDELARMMREFTDHGNTCFVASHNIDLVCKLCDRVAIVDQGCILKIFDLKNDPRLRRQVREYFFAHCKEETDHAGL